MNKEIDFNQTTDYHIQNLSLAIGSVSYNLTPLFEELNIYESMFNPVMSGNIVIRDSDGTITAEIHRNPGAISLYVKISKNKNGDLPIEKVFKVVSHEESNQSATTSTLVLTFVSQDFVESQQKKISKTYNGQTYSFIIQDILTKYLKMPKSKMQGRFEDSLGTSDIIIPLISPLAAILWCQNRALDVNYAPAFLFFENNTGFNFISVSTLMKDPLTAILNFRTKNNPNDENNLYGVISYSMTEQFDILERLMNGVDASTNITHDIFTGSININLISLKDINACLNLLDKNLYAPVIINRDGSSSDENYDSLISYRPTIFNISQSKYAQKRGISPNLLGGRSENMSLIMNQRRSILHTLLTKQITCLLPGNFELICGSKIYLDYPYSGQRQEGEENKDKIIAGNYLIVDVRHKINYNKHVTFINVASGYSQLPIAVSNHPLQQAAING